MEIELKSRSTCLCTDAPAAPGVPVVVDSDVNYIKLQWTAPATDGGAEITGYYIERRDKNTGVLIRLNEDPVPVRYAGINFILNDITLQTCNHLGYSIFKSQVSQKALKELRRLMNSFYRPDAVSDAQLAVVNTESEKVLLP